MTITLWRIKKSMGTLIWWSAHPYLQLPFKAAISSTDFFFTYELHSIYENFWHNLTQFQTKISIRLTNSRIISKTSHLANSNKKKNISLCCKKLKYFFIKKIIIFLLQVSVLLSNEKLKSFLWEKLVLFFFLTTNSFSTKWEEWTTEKN